MRTLRKIDDRLAQGERLLAILLYAGLLAVMMVNIVGRNLFGVSFQKVLEIAPVIVLWLSLVGATLGLRHQRHIKLEVLLRFLPETVAARAHRVTALAATAIMGLLFWVSLSFVANEVRLFGPWGALSVVFPLFFALASFRYFLRLLGGERRDEAP
jgi:TRAP-type C4-dicarboxylate transport system permease small subunit